MRSPRRDGDRYEKYIRTTDPETQIVRGSGSSAEKKGDLKKGNRYLIQAKRTNMASFTVKLSDLVKAEKEAMNLGRVPLFYIGFYNSDRVTDEWVMIPRWKLNSLLPE